MLEDREYRYVSPVFIYDGKTGNVARLVSAAITNNPALDGLTDLATATVQLPQTLSSQFPLENVAANTALQRVFGGTAALIGAVPTEADRQFPLHQYQQERTNELLLRVFGSGARILAGKE